MRDDRQGTNQVQEQYKRFPHLKTKRKRWSNSSKLCKCFNIWSIHAKAISKYSHCNTCNQLNHISCQRLSWQVTTAHQDVQKDVSYMQYNIGSSLIASVFSNLYFKHASDWDKGTFEEKNTWESRIFVLSCWISWFTSAFLWKLLIWFSSWDCVRIRWK